MTSRLRKYERVWFDADRHPQMSEPEVFLAYDLADALLQSEEAEKRSGSVWDAGIWKPSRRVWETRPHISKDTAPEGICLHCLSEDLSEDSCRRCGRWLPGKGPV